MCSPPQNVPVRLKSSTYCKSEREAHTVQWEQHVEHLLGFAVRARHPFQGGVQQWQQAWVVQVLHEHHLLLCQRQLLLSTDRHLQPCQLKLDICLGARLPIPSFRLEVQRLALALKCHMGIAAYTCPQPALLGLIAEGIR